MNKPNPPVASTSVGEGLTQQETAMKEVENVSSAEVEILDERPVNLFGSTDPRSALERMTEYASALVDVVRDRRLSVRIQGKEYLTVEAWQTLGALVGVYGVIEWTRPTESEDGFVARATARTLAGQVVGAAECECSRQERTWRSRDSYALRSMAQTRALSRALRAPLGQIVVLAGYEATGEEEMRTIDVEPRGPRPGIVS